MEGVARRRGLLLLFLAEEEGEGDAQDGKSDDISFCFSRVTPISFCLQDEIIKKQH